MERLACLKEVAKRVSILSTSIVGDGREDVDRSHRYRPRRSSNDGKKEGLARRTRTLLSAARQVQRGSSGPQTFDGAGRRRASTPSPPARHENVACQVQRGSEEPRTSDVLDHKLRGIDRRRGRQPGLLAPSSPTMLSTSASAWSRRAFRRNVSVLQSRRTILRKLLETSPVSAIKESKKHRAHK